VLSGATDIDISDVALHSPEFQAGTNPSS
jgi:hypothetical protein